MNTGLIRMTSRLAHSLFAVAVGVSLTLSGSAVLAQSPQSGGTLSISMESDPPGIDPLVISSFGDKQAGISVYDTLLDIDSKGKLIPNLAESFESAPDATWFKLKLRSGVKFHDDTPFDAAAVVEHFKRLMDPKNHYRWRTDLTSIDSVTASGPLEVTFKMKSPMAPFLASLANTSGMIESPTAVGKLGDQFESHPVGTGPFIFKEWRRGSQIVFTRNPNYWRGPVHLDGLVLVPMPDQQTRVSSVQAGNLDIAVNAPAKDVLEARANKKFYVHSPGSLGTSFVMVNTAAPEVADVRVRRALAHAINRKAMNKALFKGLYKIANTPFGTGLAPHERVEGYPQYDPAAARKLLADYGKPVKIQFSSSNAPVALLTAQALQQMWKKVGIETEIIPMEQQQLIATAGKKDYQIMGYRWQGDIDPDRNVYNFFHSKGSANRTNVRNPEMDRLLDAGRATTDPAARLEIYHKINNLLARELPYLFLYYFENFALVNPKVHGIPVIADGLIRARDVWKER